MADRSPKWVERGRAGSTETGDGGKGKERLRSICDVWRLQASLVKNAENGGSDFLVNFKSQWFGLMIYSYYF